MSMFSPMHYKTFSSFDLGMMKESLLNPVVVNPVSAAFPDFCKLF